MIHCYSAQVEVRSIVMSVCVSVCLSVCLNAHISETTHPNFTKFVCMLPVAVARSSSGSDVIYYVFPVLWMISRFSVMGPMALC